MLERTAHIGPFGRARAVSRGTTLSARIVADVREALFDKALKPGDFLGSEKDLESVAAGDAEGLRSPRNRPSFLDG